MKLITYLMLPIILAACSTVKHNVHSGYLTNEQGEFVLNPQGQCWRTVEWTPDLAIAECDPFLAARKKQKDKPEKEQKSEKFVAEPEEKQPQEPVAATEVSLAVLPVNEQIVNKTKSIALGLAQGSITRTEQVVAPLLLSSDASFRFGDDQLTSEGRVMVEALGSVILHRKPQNLVVNIVGHTDRVGSAQANLKLSQRRAEAVKKVLVGQGIDSQQINAIGKGSAHPISKAEDCHNRLVKCELISCLAVDRRVEVEVIGQVTNTKTVTEPIK